MKRRLARTWPLRPLLRAWHTRGRKDEGELAYWRERLEVEGELGAGHYERAYTSSFGLDPSFYAGRAVLDVGCGPRGSLEWASEASRRVGLDPLAGRYRELGTDRHAMQYVEAQAETMPFEPESFDVVSSFNSLDHVDDLDAAAAEIVRVLRPGGTFLLITDLGHDATVLEPQEFSWEVTQAFAPPLLPVEERRLEKLGSGVYESVDRAVPWDAADPRPRNGVLVARFEKGT